jgi:hypothetical protein
MRSPGSDRTGSGAAGPWPALDPTFASALEERRPVAFTHRMHEHPLLRLEEIAGLAEQLPTGSISAETAEKPLVTGDVAAAAIAVDGIGEQIRGLAHNRSWFTLLNIEQVADYRALVDQVIDGMADSARLERDALKRRQGFVFASSPGSVTSAHFDIEHSFCIQLQGHRTLSFGSFADQSSRDEEVRRYWNGALGRLAAMPALEQEVELAPGRGAYIPPYQPHWITNGDETSLSLTVTFFTRSNEDESMAQAFNERIRRVGLNPRRYGDSPGRDRVKVGAMRAYGLARRGLRLRGADTH